MRDFEQSRRDFLKATALLGSGLVVGCYLPENPRLMAFGPTSIFEPNAWIRISPDGPVTIIVAKSEMGQGVHTSMPMLVAEELEVALDRIDVVVAPADPAYKDTILGLQVTGGSTSVRSSWQSLREAGATARTMLVEAAARQWGVTAAECRAENGNVIHEPSGRRLDYGALAESAARLAPPRKVELKPKEALNLVGRPTRRLDTPAKIDGSAVFGIDVAIPGMRVATLAQCPRFGGAVSTFKASKALSAPGVERVLEIDAGIAVVADTYWNAKKGRDALEIVWTDGPQASLDDADIASQLQNALNRKGATAKRVGDPETVLKQRPATIQAVYSVPFLAHATMEPMNCAADVRADHCDIWVGTQAQGLAQETAARITGLAPDKVTVHTTYLGGGFGRRFEQDFVAQAVQISKRIQAPVKLIWSREDDIQHDLYRPATFNRLEGVLGDDGLPLLWTHRIAGPSIMSRAMPQLIKNGIDPSSVEGAAEIPYAIPNLHVEYVMQEVGVPVGFWRSVGNSQNGFVVESFIDELAVAAKIDPLDFRLRLLENHPRHRGVLELAARQAGWGTAAPPGRHRGIAMVHSFGSYVAQVAEVSVSGNREVRVHRVVCAVDCGVTVNPDTIVAQMESGIVFGLTAALKGKITIENGRVKQSNFHDYPLLRMDEMPDVEVYIVPSEEAPGGVGEPGTPPIAPAVANAVFAATGKRIRRLPIDLAHG